MRFELDDAIYESFLQHAQIEVTGKCNMHCKHCRAADEANRNMTMEEIDIILDFINNNREDNFRLTLSGGEPFVHPKIIDIIEKIKDSGIENIIITTNASLINEEILEKLNNLDIKGIGIQVSLDSIEPEKHDEFRGYKGAYKKAIHVLKLINNYDNIYSSIRMTVTHDTLKELEKMVDNAKDIGVKRIGIGAVIPVGNGGSGTLTLNKEEKRDFLERLALMNKKYKDKIDITTEDPLKFNIDNSPWGFCDGLDCNIDKSFFGGCTAGITSFNIGADGTVTPCAVLPEPIINIHDYDNIEEMSVAYGDSPVVKNLLTRHFSGKCGTCSMNRICGGCRATAKGLTGDYMASDPTCWRK